MKHRYCHFFINLKFLLLNCAYIEYIVLVASVTMYVRTIEKKKQNNESKFKMYVIIIPTTINKKNQKSFNQGILFKNYFDQHQIAVPHCAHRVKRQSEAAGVNVAL